MIKIQELLTEANKICDEMQININNFYSLNIDSMKITLQGSITDFSNIDLKNYKTRIDENIKFYKHIINNVVIIITENIEN